MASDKAPLVEIQNLNVTFPLEEGTLDAVRDVSFAIPRAGTVGLVGRAGAARR